MASRNPTISFNNPEFRGRFLEYVANTGASISNACRHFGITARSFHKYCHDKDPEFRLEYEDCRAESADRILSVLREHGELGDVQAAALYLKHVAPPPPSRQHIEVKQQHTHELTVSPDTIRSIQELQAQLEMRALESGPAYDLDLDSEEA